MVDKLKKSSEILSGFKEIIRKTVQEETRDCMRVYKATVITPPNGTVCSVQLAGDSSVLSLPYSSKVASVHSGDTVWVAVLFGSFRNAVVWETDDFR